MADTNSLGLALSGGGSRAAAFHCGTIQALAEIGLLPLVNVVSTVSGGSVFGAAWMSSKLAGKTTDQFIADMKRELHHGFVVRSLLNWKVAALLAPGFTRTELIADTFDRVFCQGRVLSELPDSPRLCLNTSVLNNGQVGKFSRWGFSTSGLGGDRDADGSNAAVPLPKFRLARAAAASAAFPIGLPPLMLGAKELAGAPRTGLLEGDDPLALSDGGVLENLGVQTLLKSHRFGTWHLVISDAGVRSVPWRPHSFGRWIVAFLISAVSASVLRRVLELMNDKENRSMRSAVMAQALQSTGGGSPQPRRGLLFVRVDQTWDRLTSGANAPGLARAKKMYDEMGGDTRVAQLNDVATGFTGLSARDVEGLAAHARWQVFALHALYGDAFPRKSQAAEEVRVS